MPLVVTVEGPMAVASEKEDEAEGLLPIISIQQAIQHLTEVNAYYDATSETFTSIKTSFFDMVVSLH